MYFKIPLDADLSRTSFRCYKEADGAVFIEYNEGFADAVDFARRSAKKGDCVLLSPASASFDAFKNFAHRGQTFKKIVMEM